MSLAVCGYHSDEVGHFNEDAPRPLVPGKEDRKVAQAKEGGQFSHKTLSHWAEGPTAMPRRLDRDLGYEPEGSAFQDGSYEPWAETLLRLLDDQDGTTLFQHFLQGLGCSELLDFWFACSGFRKVPVSEKKHRLKLAKIMYRCYLSERSCNAVSHRISEQTRCEVLDGIRCLQLDSTLFAQAHAEVQAVLESSLFPLFLRSDVYIKHTQSGEQRLKTLALSTDHQKTATPGYMTTPLCKKGVGSKSEHLPLHNTANQKSADKKKCSQRRHTCHKHIRTTQERRKTDRDLPPTPQVEIRTHTFTTELMRRLQELQTQTAEEEDDVTYANSLCHSLKMEDSPTHPHHSPRYCHMDLGISQLQMTSEDLEKCVRNTLHTHAHKHSTHWVQTKTCHYKAACSSTTVVYYFCGEAIPYRTCVQGNTVTLRQFKSLLCGRGPYRFYFKRANSEFDCSVLYEEIQEDETTLPIFDHKIIAKVERMYE